MPSKDLEELAALMAPGRSKWERLAHLRKAWAQVRTLSPAERETLALKLGLEKGSDLLDRLVDEHPERAPPKSVLRALRDVDPAAVRDLSRELIAESPAERLATLEATANTIAEHALDPIAESWVAPAAPGPLAPAAPGSPLAATTAPPGHPQNPFAAGSPFAAPSARGTMPATVAARGAMPAFVAASEAASTGPVTAPPVAAAPAAVPRMAPHAAPPAPAPQPHAAPAAAPHTAPPAPTPQPHVTDAAIARLAQMPLLQRFRVLRFEMMGVLTAGDARRVLRAFPDGWARRRAFLALLDEGVPLDASVLDELGGRADRRWCEQALGREPTG